MVTEHVRRITSTYVLEDTMYSNQLTLSPEKGRTGTSHPSANSGSDEAARALLKHRLEKYEKPFASLASAPQLKQCKPRIEVILSNMPVFWQEWHVTAGQKLAHFAGGLPEEDKQALKTVNHAIELVNISRIATGMRVQSTLPTVIGLLHEFSNPEHTTGMGFKDQLMQLSSALKCKPSTSPAMPHKEWRKSAGGRSPTTSPDPFLAPDSGLSTTTVNQKKARHRSLDPNPVLPKFEAYANPALRPEGDTSTTTTTTTTTITTTTTTSPSPATKHVAWSIPTKVGFSVTELEPPVSQAEVKVFVVDLDRVANGLAIFGDRLASVSGWEAVEGVSKLKSALSMLKSRRRSQNPEEIWREAVSGASLSVNEKAALKDAASKLQPQAHKLDAAGDLWALVDLIVNAVNTLGAMPHKD
jgi:hypothetical protein